MMEESERNRIERLLALLSLGAVVALEKEAITVYEVERLLFSPGTMSLLKDAGISKAVINLIHAGTELDDILDHIPDSFPNTLKDLKRKAVRILANTDPTSPDLDNWLKRML
jgi:hypothetical protein